MYKPLIACLALLLIVSGCRKDSSPDNGNPGGNQPLFIITSISPDTAIVGSIVTIRGKGFGTVTSDIEVKVNDIPAEVISVADTIIAALIVQGTTSGSISVTVKDKTLTTNRKIVVTTPPPSISLSITSFSPESGKTGDQVTIKGTGFSVAASANQVKINTAPANVISSTDTTLVVKVPQAASSGKISVVIQGRTAVSTKDFNVVAVLPFLAIASFSPESGKQGEQVRVKGSGFSSIAEANQVTINTTAAEVVSATDTLLVIKVPAGAATGRISISTQGRSVSSTKNFTVIVDHWMQKADYYHRGQYTESDNYINGFSIGGRGYFFENSELWEYDPLMDKWTEKTKLPSTRYKKFCFTFTVGGKAYVGLGEEGIGNDGNLPDDKEVWEYNPVGNQWTRKRDFPGVARVAAFGFSVGNMGYVGGGDATNDGRGMVRDFWQYDPQTDQWTRKADCPGSNLIGVSGFSIQGYGYVLEAGLGDPSAPISMIKSAPFWLYDPAADRWYQKAFLSIPDQYISSATCFSIINQGYASVSTFKIEGQISSSSFWKYDPSTNGWTQGPDVGGGIRKFASSFSIGGKGYVGAGTGRYFDVIKKDLWEYTPQ